MAIGEGGFRDVPQAAPVPRPQVLPYGTWTNANPTGNPGPVVAGSMAYSPDADRILLVSGAASTIGLTWIYNPTGNVWAAVPNGSATPGALAGSSLVYDEALRQFVLFGGYHPYANPPSLGENATWLFDPATLVWTNVTPAVSPPTRFGQAMVYVPGTDEIVLFGGTHETWLPSFGGVYVSTLTDTWVYDAVANTWTNVTPTFSPTWNSNPHMWYDPAFGKVLLLTQIPGETWLYDATLSTWSKLANQSGPFDDWPAAAYDAAAESLVVFSGGFDSLGNDTWWFSAAAQTWTKTFVGTAPPPPRYGAMAAYDSENGYLILYGGRDYATTLNDTWLYRPTSPPALSASIEADPVQGPAPLIVAFHGVPSGGIAPYTYAWDFGDGSGDAVTDPSHAYATAGSYTARLNVSDATGNSTTTNVTIDAQPAVAWYFAVPPAENLLWAIGLTVAVAVVAGLATYRILRPRPPPKG